MDDKQYAFVYPILWGMAKEMGTELWCTGTVWIIHRVLLHIKLWIFESWVNDRNRIMHREIRRGFREVPEVWEIFELYE